LNLVYNHQTTRMLVSTILRRIATWYDYILYTELANIMSREFLPVKDIYSVLQLEAESTPGP
jgi:hypothetical protein